MNSMCLCMAIVHAFQRARMAILGVKIPERDAEAEALSSCEVDQSAFPTGGPKLPYRSLDLLFNNRNVWMNLQDPSPSKVWFDIWSPLILSSQSSSFISPFPVPLRVHLPLSFLLFFSSLSYLSSSSFRFQSLSRLNLFVQEKWHQFCPGLYDLPPCFITRGFGAKVADWQFERAS
ncbi:c2 domain protein, partial [Cystoisospora suis]